MSSPARALASSVKATVSVKEPSSATANVPPMISGRILRSSPVSASSALTSARSTALPWITWTKPASSDPPSRNTLTSSQSEKTAGPSRAAAIRSAHVPCSGRSELAMACSREENRTTPMNWSSSVKPNVPPSQPPGAPTSVCHDSVSARSSSRRVQGAWITWMNIPCPSTSLRLRVGRDAGVEEHARLVAERPGVVPGLRDHDVPGVHGHLGAVVVPDGHAAGDADAGVPDLAGVGAGDRLDVLGPAPARLEGAAAEREVAERDDVHVTVGVERAGLVGLVDVLDG